MQQHLSQKARKQMQQQQNSLDPLPKTSASQQHFRDPLPKTLVMQQQHSIGTVRSLRQLVTIEPEQLSAVANTDDGWELVEMTIDSGAAETVVPPESINAVSTTPSEASRRGTTYEVANGQRIANLGEKTFCAATDEGYVRQLKAQIAEVNRPLLSVSRLIAAGNTVTFSPEGSCIRDASGE